MARADDEARFVWLAGGGRLERPCAQRVIRVGLCRRSVDRLCDACAKPVCFVHVSLARVDPAAPGGRLSRWDGDCPEICVTCRVLERWWGEGRIETVPDEVREAFYLSPEAVGHVGAYEHRWLEARGVRMTRYGRVVRYGSG